MGPDDQRVGWQRTATTDYLLVGFNPTNQFIGTSASVGNPARTVFFHPGASGENSVVRWTSPGTHSYSIATTFDPRDNTTTTVAVLKNNTLPPLFTADISVGNPASFTTSMSLQAGDIIDFSVDMGPNGNYFYDNTGLGATITQQ